MKKAKIVFKDGYWGAYRRVWLFFWTRGFDDPNGIGTFKSMDINAVHNWLWERGLKC